MTSATLIYSPHLNEIPPQKRGVTGPSYTTDRIPAVLLKVVRLDFSGPVPRKK